MQSANDNTGGSRAGLGARLLPSLSDVAFLMPAILLFLRLDGARHLLSDGDTGWHIRAGEWMLANGRVPDKDIFSYTKAGEPWFAWEWLWDVIFGWLHQQAGMAAVVVASMLALSVTFLLLFRLARRSTSNVLLAFGATMLAIAGSTMHWLARPHLFTLLFVVIFCSLLERVREQGRTRLLWWLPPLMVLWTNLHGGFFVGVLLLVCYAAGEATGWLVERDRDAARAALRRSKPYLAAAAACAAVTLVNPYFYRLHLHMFHYLTGSRHIWNISEFQGTNFQHGAAPFFEPMVLLGAVAAAWSLHRKRFAHAYLLLGWLHLGLFAVRNLPIYLVVAAPIVARALEEWLELLSNAPLAAWAGRACGGFRNLAREFGAVDALPRVYAVSAAGVVAVGALFCLPSPPEKFRAEYDPKNYPAAALGVIREAGASAKVFTDDEWGDYLIYRLHPATKVFVDGRSDFYGDTFSEKYLDLLNARYGWDQTLRNYGVDTVLLRVGAPLTAALKESRCWRPVYDDGAAIVFRARQAASPAPAPESVQASAAGGGGEENRGRAITETRQRDPRITKPTKRSETL